MTDTTFSRQEAHGRPLVRAAAHADAGWRADELPAGEGRRYTRRGAGGRRLVECQGPWRASSSRSCSAGVSPDGARVVSEESLAETWEPGVQIAPGVSYGLGWTVSDYQGQPLLYHTGGTLGYNAEVAFLPEAGIGVAVVLNRSNVLAFPEAVRHRVFEAAFDQPPAGDAGVAFAVQQQQAFVADVASTVVPLDEAAVAPYLGTWTHQALGDVALTLDGGRLVADAGEIASEIGGGARWGNGRIVLRHGDAAVRGVARVAAGRGRNAIASGVRPGIGRELRVRADAASRRDADGVTALADSLPPRYSPPPSG